MFFYSYFYCYLDNFSCDIFYIREYKNTKNKKINNYNFIKSNENTITNNNTIINNENNILNNNDVQGLKERSIKNVKMEH